MKNKIDILEVVSPPSCNRVLSCMSAVVGICYLTAIPLIGEKNYFFVAILLFLHIIIAVLGLLYYNNRRVEIYEEYMVYRSPFGKAVSFSPYSVEVIIIRRITRRHTGGLVIQAGRQKIQVPENYNNYGILEQILLRTAKSVKEKKGVM